MQPEPDDIEALHLLISFHLAEGQFQDAIAGFQQLIAWQPDNPEHYYSLGVLWLEHGQLENAIACFQTALQLNPFATKPINDVLYQLAQAELWDVVIAIALGALQVNPAWNSGFLYIGNALQQQGEIKAAQSCALGLLPTQLIQQFSFANCVSTQLSADSTDAITHLFVDEAEAVELPTLQTHPTMPQPGDETSVVETCHLSIPPTYIVAIPTGKVWADFYTRAIFTSAGTLVEDASIGNMVLIAASDKLPVPEAFEGTLAVLTIRFSHNYFHWMYDLLPKLNVLEKAQISLSAIDAFLVNECEYPFQRETLNLLGISDEKILDYPIYYGTANHLLVPISEFAGKGRISKQSCDFLRRKLLPAIAPQPESYPTRFYISRESANYRKVLNEDEIMALLRPLGFEQIKLETLSVREQISLFKTAEIVIAPHGAGLSNLVFANPGTTVIEIFLPDERLDYYQLISHHVGINHYYLIADTSEPCIQQVSYGVMSIETPQINLIISPDSLRSRLVAAGIKL